MKILLTILLMVIIASVAWAEKPTQPVDNTISRIECPLENVAYDWDFAESDQGFTTGPCDDGGLPCWEYGVNEAVWPDALWYTVVFGNYPNDAGESLISPSFVVDASAYLVEVWHGYAIEEGYDGGNLSVNGVVVEPLEGYPDEEISDSTGWYAWCVDGEPGFTGAGGLDLYNCFDLSAFMGEEVQLSFDFGSDSTATEPGWGIGYVRVGSDVVTTDGTTWSAVKGLYR
jgi:hypothetical protein